MEYIFIGVIVGLVMGMTGAGGALVSIPLFINLLNKSVKEATILSLLVVMIGALIGFIFQNKKADFKIVFIFAGFGALANATLLFVKKLIPAQMIAIMLSAVVIYSLWSLWKSSKTKITIEKKPGLPLMAASGLVLGLVTTFTGLGGGVLIIPLLIQVFKQSYLEALPTSLLSIFLIAATSFALQITAWPNLIGLSQVSLLALGVIGAVGALTLLLKQFKKLNTDIWRKSLFSIIALYAVVSVFRASL